MKFSSPLTSFYWNTENPNLIGCSSIDTTCTLWDIEKQAISTQIIAHDKEVFDISFSKYQNQFATASADASIRTFDTRNLDQSTILFESMDKTPFLRVAWNKENEYILATILMEKKEVLILDIRLPMTPFITLCGHSDSVNSIAWAPKSPFHICTVGDDTKAYIWDLEVENSKSQEPLEPILTYSAEAEIRNLLWPHPHIDWVAITFQNTLQLLKV